MPELRFGRIAACGTGRQTVLGAILAMATLSSVVIPAFAAEPAGRVAEAEGRSTGLHEGAIRQLARDADVFLQELVQTSAGARLALALGVDTRVLLGERTRLKIERSVVDRGGTMLLQSGAILFDRPNDSPQKGFVVRTSFAIVAARGTEFYVGPDVRPDKTGIEVFVARGSVTVRNNAGRVRVRAGEGTAVPSPDVAPEEPRAWGEPRIQAAYERAGASR